MAGPVAVGGGLLGVVVLLVNFFLSGEVDISQLQRAEQRTLSPKEQTAEDSLAQFASVVLKETEDVWTTVFAEAGHTYKEPTLVLFTGRVSSACGSASSASGPFYCPADQQLYVDLSFFNELRQRFGAPGDFAMAYVIAHEVGHHVQTLLGTTAKMEELRNRGVSQEVYNSHSVQFELQADFLAGVWAHHTARKDLLDAGDIAEALQAANAIGDDRLQQQSQGVVVPESFTHGTSAQRMHCSNAGTVRETFQQGIPSPPRSELFLTNAGCTSSSRSHRAHEQIKKKRCT